MGLFSKGSRTFSDYSPQKSLGVVTPQQVAEWLGPEPSIVERLIPNKSSLNSLSAKFQSIESKRRDGRLP